MRATPPVPVPDGNAQGSMISMGEGKVLVATNVGLGRRVLTARTSRDGGASWEQHAIVDNGAAAYSSLADLGGGWAGCLYETARESPVRAEGTQTAPPMQKASLRENNVLRFVKFRVMSDAQIETCVAE